MTNHRLATLGSTIGDPILCKVVGFGGLTAGIAVTVANLDDGGIASLFGQIRGDVVGIIAAVAATVAAFCWALTHYPIVRRIMNAVGWVCAIAFLVGLAAGLVGLVSFSAVGWARLLGWSPFGMDPSGDAGLAFGALIVAGSLVVLGACLTPFAAHGPANFRAENKVGVTMILGVFLLLLPGFASAMTGLEKLGNVSIHTPR